jgi:hypothetical protein
LQADRIYGGPVWFKITSVGVNAASMPVWRIRPFWGIAMVNAFLEMLALSEFPPAIAGQCFLRI